MSDDALALAAITGGVPQDAEYDAVYAAVTATERGRWFLSEFAGRNRHADTRSITAALARIEAAIDAATPSGAVSVRHPAAVAATIDRIGAAIQTERHAIAAAVARIADIIGELRERAVKTALCDALDAELREMAGGEHGGAADAAKLLRELGAEIDALIAAARMDDKADASPASLAAADGATNMTEVAPVASRPAEQVADGSEEDVSSDPLDMAWRDDKKLAAAAAALSADAAILQPHQGAEARDVESAHRAGSYIEPPDFVFAPPARAPDRDGEVEASEQSGRAHPLLPATDLPTDPTEDPADLFEAAPDGVAAPSSAPAPPASPTAIPASPATPPVQLPTPQLRIAAASAIRSAPRPVPSNPLAALRALSEEELIALFG